MVATSNFPKHPIHGQLYVDNGGIQWQFEAARQRWAQLSVFEDISTVSPTNAGLVSPEVYNQLEQLRVSAEKIDLSTFKIYPGLDAYYYYFYSPDGLIDIRYQGNGVISIDVNEQKLVSYLYRNLCIGDRGQQGEQGIEGDPGIAAPNEPIFYPKHNNSMISGEVYAPLPIGTYYPHSTITPISIRLYGLYAIPSDYALSDQLNYWVGVIGNVSASEEEKTVFSRLRKEIINQSLNGSTQSINLSPVIVSATQLNPSAILEIDVNPIDGTFEIVNNGIRANASDIYVKFDKELGYLQFEVIANWPDDVVYKVRQRGPTGDRGDIPSGYITQVDCAFPDDANVRPDTALVHARLDCETNTFYVSYDRLPSQDAFMLISTDSDVAATTTLPVVKGRYTAVEKTAGAIKKVASLVEDFIDIDVDDPVFQNWEPQPGCHTKRSFEKHKFDWISDTDIAECAEELTWYGPDGARPGKYPHTIVLPSEPEDDGCCQDDYFIFPETGDC